MNNDGMDKVVEALKERDNFLISAHINPEGDSIGSQSALFNMLKKMGKKAVIVNQDVVPDNLRFIPSSNRIIFSVPEDFHLETALIIDCPVKNRVGRIAPEVDKACCVINIDHHVSNEYFGDIDWVEPETSSVGEMVYCLHERLGMEVDNETAIALYAAIITDTGMFNYDNTSGRTHEIVGELIKKGVEPSAVFSEIYEQKSLTQLRILGRVLGAIQIVEGGSVAYMSLTSDMCMEENVSTVSTEEFINYPRSIKGVEVAVFFKQKAGSKDAVDVSFRSSGNIDVNLVASRFGGGGHKRASGCKLTCGLDEAKKKVLAELNKATGSLQ